MNRAPYTSSKFSLPWLRVCAVVGALVGLSACGPKKPPETPPKPKPEQMEGGREAASPSRRASDNRPRPWAEEHGPFDSDRLGIGAYRVHRQEQESGKQGQGKKGKQGKKAKGKQGK